MADKWETVVLKTLSDGESKYKPGVRYQTRVVQKFKNGKHAAIKVQAGELGPHPTSGELRFKLGDLSIIDIKKIVAVLPEIEALIKNPPPYPPELQAAADEVQF